jgi:protein TonB
MKEYGRFPAALLCAAAFHICAFLAAGLYLSRPSGETENLHIEVSIEQQAGPPESGGGTPMAAESAPAAAPAAPQEPPAPEPEQPDLLPDPEPLPVPEPLIEPDDAISALPSETEPVAVREETAALPRASVTSPGGTGSGGTAYGTPGAPGGSGVGSGTGSGPSGGGGSASDERFIPFYKVDQKPEIITQAKLEYPPEARRRNIEGTVIVEADIDEKGRAVNVRLVKSAGYGFDEAALRYIKESAFSPASIGKKPVAVRMRFTVRFGLTD